jgi:GntR family transcriptional regulator
VDEAVKYREIAADLQHKIESGELAPGTRLRSDAELSELYAASRNTVREAVKILVTRGLVEKPPNRGAFVLEKIAPFMTVITVDSGFGGFRGAANSSDAASSNREFTVTTPKVEIQTAPAGIAAELELSEDDTVVIRHQERSIDGVLWSIQTSYYPMEFVQRGATGLLQVTDIPEGVRRYLDGVLGIKEVGSHDTMRVRAPSAAEATAFKIADDGRIAVFETRQVGVDESRRPLRVTISAYPADRNQFSMETGILAEKPQQPD